MIKNNKWLLVVAATLLACDKADDEIVVVPEAPLTAGSANFSNYIGIGDSLTAGYSDGSLFKAGQENSFANIIASQFILVGGGDFKIPFTNDNIGGLLIGGKKVLDAAGNDAYPPRRYYSGNADNPSVILNAMQTNEVGVRLTGTFNNLGVPGSKSYELLAPGYGSLSNLSLGRANPYFVRFAANDQTNVLGQAISQNPSFFSLWTGNNDVLLYALAGGAAVDQTGNPDVSTYGRNDLTDPTLFEGVFTELLKGRANTFKGLTSDGAKGVVANIPYVSSIPNFTTVTVKPVAPTSYFNNNEAPGVRKEISADDIATIKSLNANVFTFLSAVLPDRFQKLSESTNNPVIIVDEDLEDKSATILAAATNSGNQTLVSLAQFFAGTFGKARQTKAGDLIPLGTGAVIGTDAQLPQGVPQSLGKFGISYPLRDQHVLIPSEIATLKRVTDAYNLTIKKLADENNLAFVDANALLVKIASGTFTTGNYSVTSSFVVGGAFSMDGVHPSARGHAIVANEFLKAINAKYGSNFKPVDPAQYLIQYPQSLR
jgi:lysophospholipase L1-like esterase